ncbi:MAG: 16S rRNA (cytidine(1402)-2'-O)-methyltransferase [Flavobacteriales bacterium]
MKLTVVPTPIGNLEDITLRAIRVLKEVDLIIAEDTRVTQKLLNHIGVGKKTESFHTANEHGKLNYLIDKIKNLDHVALVSDAGTPGISDPGFLLVRACIENQIPVECLPGPTAFVPALVMSGFPTDTFIFEGFLPHKKGRQTRVEGWKEEEKTVVFYESPHRIQKAIELMLKILGPDRKICICREITKLYEEIIRGTVQEVFDQIHERDLKGEMVIVLKGIE